MDKLDRISVLILPLPTKILWAIIENPPIQVPTNTHIFFVVKPLNFGPTKLNDFAVASLQNA